MNKGNLTISGILQPPLTSLMGVSIGNIYNTQTNIIGVSIPNIDVKVDKIIGVSIPQFLTRNEFIIPSTFTTWGSDYTTDKYIKNSGKLTINSNTTNNEIQIENSSGNFQFNK